VQEHGFFSLNGDFRCELDSLIDRASRVDWYFPLHQLNRRALAIISNHSQSFGKFFRRQPHVRNQPTERTGLQVGRMHWNNKTPVIGFPQINSVATSLTIEYETKSFRYAHHFPRTLCRKFAHVGIATSTGRIKISSIGSGSLCACRLSMYTAIASWALASVSSKVFPSV
jgi:hypothetical protein